MPAPWAVDTGTEYFARLARQVVGSGTKYKQRYLDDLEWRLHGEKGVNQLELTD